MKKLFSVLAVIMLLGAVPARADIQNISAPDPLNFVVINSTSLSQMQLVQPRNYILDIPAFFSSLTLTFAVTPNLDSLVFGATCTADGSAPNSSVINAPGVFAQVYGQVTANNKMGTVSQTVTLTAGQSESIYLSVIGCSQLNLSFTTFAGTGSDTIRVQGTFSNSSSVPTFGGLPGSAMIGMSGFNLSVPTPIAVNSTGQMPIAGAVTGTDGNLNGASSQLFCNQLSSTCPLQIMPLLFNGTSWDRQFYCPNTVTFSVASTVTQVVAAQAAKIRICSFSLQPSTVTAGSVDIVTGTGSNCATGTATLSGAFTLPASAVVDISPAISSMGPLTTGNAVAVCIRTVTSTVNGFLTWETH